MLRRLLLGFLRPELPSAVNLQVPSAPPGDVIQHIVEFTARLRGLERRRPAELERREVERVEEPWTLATNLVAKIYGYFQSA